MKPLAPNSMIQNRYLVVQMIGKGGMGEVYLAVDQRLGSAVALKRTFFSDNSALGSAFEREARILGRLRHPVLPKVIDHFAENGDQFLVMEHISGDDLAKRLENATAPFPVNWVMFWADQMLDALSYLHSHEPAIVHRDIKPQNLKLTDENHIVLLDFGLSKDFDSSTTGNSMNSASVAGYSPHFASMEQIRGTGTDARSDLYSLSATLYQLLTNTIPADALTRADALLGGNKDPIIPLNEINPEIPPAVSEVILKGAELRQDQRFSTAAEMQKALRRAFKQEKYEEIDDVTIDMRGVFGAMPPRSPQTNPSEMATRAQPAAIPSVPGTVPANGDEPKQSSVKTEVIPVAQTSDEETETRLASQLSERMPPAAAVAAAGVHSEPSPGVEVKIPATAANAKSSKAGLIIAVLAGLLVLGVAAGGAGWYFLSKQSAAVKPSPSPSPSPAPASPSPSPTVAVLVAEQNSNSNSNTSDVGTTNTNSDNSPRTTVPGVAPRQPATGKNPPASGQPAAPKNTPKPKAKDDRTVILQ